MVWMGLYPVKRCIRMVDIENLQYPVFGQAEVGMQKKSTVDETNGDAFAGIGRMGRQPLRNGEDVVITRPRDVRDRLELRRES